MVINRAKAREIDSNSSYVSEDEDDYLGMDTDRAQHKLVHWRHRRSEGPGGTQHCTDHSHSHKPGEWKRAVTQVHPAMHPIKHTLQFALFSFTKVSRMCCYSLERIQNSCLKKRALLSSICSSFPLQALAEAGPGSSGRGTAALPASLLCPHANNSSLGAQKCQEGSSQSQKTPASPPRGYTASKCHIKDKCSRAVCFRRIFVLQKRRLHRGSSQYHNLFLTRVGGWSR